jgi:hypothetical protein
MSDYENETQEQAEGDRDTVLQEEQQGTGYGADEGERADALTDEQQ